jgi:hypothetical protein
MFSRKFAKAALERAIRAGAASVLSFWVVGDGIFNTANVDLGNAGGVFLGGAVVSLLLSLAGGTTGNGPSLTDAETLKPHA